MFQGFSPKANEFLWGIRLNNDRGWFEAHKQEYLDLVAAPLRELGDEVTQAFWELFPKWGLNLHVSRIYRDARRLHGRGPYKESLWLSVEQAGEQWTARPTFWFELMPEGWTYGMGYWMPRPATMAKLRARITRDPGTMEKLTKKLAGQTEFTLETQDYKRPKAAAPSPQLEPWFRAKSFAIIHEDKLTEELFSREIVGRVRAGWEFLLPYYDYFVTLDGDPDPSQEEIPHRSMPSVSSEKG